MTTTHRPPIAGLSNGDADQLVGRLLGLLGPAARADVLVPFAGDGRIVRTVRRWFPQAHIDAVEPDTRHAETLLDVFMADPFVEVYAWTLAQFVANSPGMTWTAAVVTPPLGDLDNPGTEWVEHVATAWSVLRPGGHLLAVVPDMTGRPGRATPDAVGRLYGRLYAAGGRAVRPCWGDSRTVILDLQRGAR